MEVLSPYLAAFGTIAGLHTHMRQYTFERRIEVRGGYQRARPKRCEMEEENLSHPRHLVRRVTSANVDDNYLMTRFVAYNTQVSIPFETSRCPAWSQDEEDVQL